MRSNKPPIFVFGLTDNGTRDRGISSTTPTSGSLTEGTRVDLSPDLGQGRGTVERDDKGVWDRSGGRETKEK